MQTILFSNRITDSLLEIIGEMKPHSVHVVTDTTVERLVIPGLGLPPEWQIIAVPDGDENKNLTSLTYIWESLIAGGATRQSVVVCIGGGVVTDMGGMAAATFKRGVRFVNVPTTLLAAVDAAVGGKTGINLGGLKNEVGVFAPADTVIISTATLATLPPEQLLSGYAEMLKHGLLDGEEPFGRLLAFDPVEGSPDTLLSLLEESVKVKEHIVEADPREKGIRRALNFGHTVGHAIEELALEHRRHISHGLAVAAGMAVELIISHMLHGFPSATLHLYIDYLRDHGYPTPAITCDDYLHLLELMSHDKKNPSPDAISFTLLSAPGQIHTDCIVPPPGIFTAIDIYRDIMGI